MSALLQSLEGFSYLNFVLELLAFRVPCPSCLRSPHARSDPSRKMDRGNLYLQLHTLHFACVVTQVMFGFQLGSPGAGRLFKLPHFPTSQQRNPGLMVLDISSCLSL